MTRRKITQDVFAFLDKASVLYGRIQEETFSYRMFSDVVNEGLESPIEDLFYIALNLQCAAQFSEIQIAPQAKIGSFRVDFVVSLGAPSASASSSPVVVELDGHDFHDKNKHQRSYEKARDRFLVKRGYKVLHFTGSDVVSDPLKVAHEVLDVLGVMDRIYDPENPVGIE